jgi:hypothetical protein
MSVSWVTNITILGPAMSGCFVNRSGWSVSMDGKEAMLIGGTTPFAMTITERITMGMFSQGVTTRTERTGRTNIDAGRKANRINMEIKELLARWHVLLNEPGDAIDLRDVFQERLDILHRLNELGTRDIEGVSIFNAMESTSASMREVDRASVA